MGGGKAQAGGCWRPKGTRRESPLTTPGPSGEAPATTSEAASAMARETLTPDGPAAFNGTAPPAEAGGGGGRGGGAGAAPSLSPSPQRPWAWRRCGRGLCAGRCWPPSPPACWWAGRPAGPGAASSAGASSASSAASTPPGSSWRRPEPGLEAGGRPRRPGVMAAVNAALHRATASPCCGALRGTRGDKRTRRSRGGRVGAGGDGERCGAPALAAGKGPSLRRTGGRE